MPRRSYRQLVLALAWLLAAAQHAPAADRPEPRVFSGPSDQVKNVIFLNGFTRVAESAKKSITIWDTATGAQVASLEGHSDAVSGLALSPDGTRLASTGFDATLRIWDVATFHQLHVFKLPRAGISINFTPDGRRILCSMQVDITRVLDADTGETLKDLQHSGYNSCYSPDAQSFFTITYKQVQCYRAGSYQVAWESPSPRSHPFRLKATPDGKLLVIPAEKSGVVLKDAADGHDVRTVSFPGEEAFGLAISPNGAWALTGTDAGNVYQWEIATGRILQKYAGHTRAVYALAISDDATMFASGAGDATVRTWRVGSPDAANLPPAVATTAPATPGLTAQTMSPPPTTTPPAVATAATPPARTPKRQPAPTDDPGAVKKNLSSITSMMVRLAEDGTATGLTSDVIASVPAESRRNHDGSVRFVRGVGDQMRVSMEEAERAVRIDHPHWSGEIQLSFGEKYTEHDGGSGGTAFAVLIRSLIDGIDLDPKCALTGDITVDSKVRKVGAVAAKLRGATVDGCLYAGIPADNETALADMALLYGDAALWDVQTLGLKTLSDAIDLVRTDRPAPLAEALQLFTTVQPSLAKSGRATLKDPATLATLRRVVELAPNHLSAKLLLAIADKRADTTLSAGESLYQISVVSYPFRRYLLGQERVDRNALPQGTAANARKKVLKLRPIIHKDFQVILNDLNAVIDQVEAASNGTGRDANLKEKKDAFFQHLSGVTENRDVLEKLVREGF